MLLPQSAAVIVTRHTLFSLPWSYYNSATSSWPWWLTGMCIYLISIMSYLVFSTATYLLSGEQQNEPKELKIKACRRMDSAQSISVWMSRYYTFQHEQTVGSSAVVNSFSVPLSPQKQQECSSTAALPPSFLQTKARANCWRMDWAVGGRGKRVNDKKSRETKTVGKRELWKNERKAERRCEIVN